MFFFFIFFFKQKTAYEMRISDWSSDVCSSDLGFLRCGSAIASAIALMSASAVFAQETDSTTSEARAETDIIVTGTRVRTPGLTSTSPISAAAGEQISLQRAVPIEAFSVKLPQLAGGVHSTWVGRVAFGATPLHLRNHRLQPPTGTGA